MRSTGRANAAPFRPEVSLPGNGQAGIKGVAPEVSFGAYRVFGCSGSTSDDVLLQAYERAYADGMQVINQSLGANKQWPEFPTAQASTRLVNKLTKEKQKGYEKGKVEDWALEANQIAREKAYTDGEPLPKKNEGPAKLSEEYMTKNAAVIEEQLTKGGVRLAKFLNDTFKD